MCKQRTNIMYACKDARCKESTNKCSIHVIDHKAMMDGWMGRWALSLQTQRYNQHLYPDHTAGYMYLLTEFTSSVEWR